MAATYKKAPAPHKTRVTEPHEPTHEPTNVPTTSVTWKNRFQLLQCSISPWYVRLKWPDFEHIMTKLLKQKICCCNYYLNSLYTKFYNKWVMLSSETAWNTIECQFWACHTPWYSVMKCDTQSILPQAIGLLWFIIYWHALLKMCMQWPRWLLGKQHLATPSPLSLSHSATHSWTLSSCSAFISLHLTSI